MQLAQSDPAIRSEIVMRRRRSGAAPAMTRRSLDAVFADSMARLGPFEPAPKLAVAVSGGADSMALAVLADRWARRRGGAIVALVVDHGLRAESRNEARATRVRLAALGIESRLLVWHGDKPHSGLQAAARVARYRLLEGWCARHAVLHLITAHQQDDQAETLLMRRARGSGTDGLAAMPAVVEREFVRLLRPLLEVPRAALAAFLRRRGIGWIEDPSNVNPVFTRTRVRAALAAEGAGAAPHAAAARRMAEARARVEAATARLLARHAAVFPQGYARVARDALVGAPAELARRALQRLLACIGGAPYPPRSERLDGLLAALADPSFRGRTLAGCRVVPDGAALLIVREVRGTTTVRVSAVAPVTWDGRFRLRPASVDQGPARWLAALGEAGWIEIVRRRPDLRRCRLPFAVKVALPAIRDRRGILAVPHLGYGRVSRKTASLMAKPVDFRPVRALCPTEFPVA